MAAEENATELKFSKESLFLSTLCLWKSAVSKYKFNTIILNDTISINLKTLN